MKKFTTLMLTLALCAGLCVPASAAKTVASTQNLSVDGAVVDCEKYNIDGSNYFKLRDLAALLNGSQAQFSVGYDAATNLVTISTGGYYEYNGSELVIGADKSATAVESRQSIQINGEEVSGVSVYNIGGNNYFKLRDLADALGFEVGYDEATRTAAVTAAPFETVVACAYDAAGNMISEITAADYGTYTRTMTYDDNGNLLVDDDRYTAAEGMVGMNGYKDTYTYDAAGNVTKIENYFYANAGKAVTEYTYDDQGRVLTETYTGDDQVIITTCSYTGNTVTTKVEMDGEAFSSYTATLGADGNPVSVTGTSLETGDYTASYTYNENGDVLTSKYTDAEGSYEITYTYDANGNEIKCVYAGYNETITSVKTYVYDAAGRILYSESSNDYTDGTSVTVNVYNALGQKVLTREFNAMG